MSDETGIDFGALTAQASAMLDAAPAAVSAVPAVEPVAAAAVVEVPVVAAEVAVADKAVDPPAPQAAELADDALVKIVVDGEEQIVPWKEAKAGYSRTAKFTKSMQQVAAERKQVEASQNHIAELENQQNQLRAFLRDKNAVLQFVQQAFPEQAQPVVANPDEIATVGQAEAFARAQAASVEQKIAAMQQTVANQIAAATSQIENARQTAVHATAIQSTLSEIFTANPVLNAIPNAEDLIRFNVAQLQPTTEAEALAAFKQVAQGMVEDIGKHFKANEKIQKVAAAKQKLESSSIEPAGGAAPQQQPTNFKNTDGTVNWDSVKAAAKAML